MKTGENTVRKLSISVVLNKILDFFSNDVIITTDEGVRYIISPRQGMWIHPDDIGKLIASPSVQRQVEAVRRIEAASE